MIEMEINFHQVINILDFLIASHSGVIKNLPWVFFEPSQNLALDLPFFMLFIIVSSEGAAVSQATDIVEPGVLYFRNCENKKTIWINFRHPRTAVQNELFHIFHISVIFGELKWVVKGFRVRNYRYHF